MLLFHIPSYSYSEKEAWINASMTEIPGYPLAVEAVFTFPLLPSSHVCNDFFSIETLRFSWYLASTFCVVQPN